MVYEGPQVIMYSNSRFIYMIKGSCIQRVQDLISSASRIIPSITGRYVGIEEEEDDGIPFEEKMEKLTSQLYKQFNEGIQLEVEIRKDLKEFGYGE